MEVHWVNSLYGIAFGGNCFYWKLSNVRHQCGSHQCGSIKKVVSYCAILVRKYMVFPMIFWILQIFND